LEVDEVLTEAQDRFFEGDLKAAEELCLKVLQISKQESDVYDLLSIIYFQSNPPEYLKALEISQDWMKNCKKGPPFKQALMQLKSSYYTNNGALLEEAAQRISKVDSVLEKSLAAALLADMGHSHSALKLAPECVISEDNPEFSETTVISEIIIVNTLHSWTMIKANQAERQSAVETLLTLTKENYPEDVEGLGLTFSLLALYELEYNSDKEAATQLIAAAENKKVKDKNVLAVEALLHNSQPMDSINVHTLIRKRLIK